MKYIILSIYILFPLAIIISLFFIAYFSLSLWKKKVRMGKRSPLKYKKLWRSPGQSLREQVEEKDNDMVIELCMLPLSILVYMPFYFSFFHTYLSNSDINIRTNLSIIVTFNLLLIIFLIWKIIRTWGEKHNLQLGLDGEVYVGQQLDHLMLVGCRVYHDYQTPDIGNLDHIVVSPAGLFVVETKGNYKPDKNRGEKDYTVIFDGDKLHFSDVFSTDKPLRQAIRNAEYFSTWLSSAVGEKVKAIPVVAVAGWKVHFDKFPQNGKIYNGKLENKSGQFVKDELEKRFFRKNNGLAPIINDSLFKRITHQIDQRCRDITPLAYDK